MATAEKNPKSQRFATALIGSVHEQDKRRGEDDIKAHFISFSATSCAIRTGTRLEQGRVYVIELPLNPLGPGLSSEVLTAQARVAWGRDDYNIDTFHMYGLEFLEPVREELVREVLACTDQLSDQAPTRIDFLDKESA